MASFLKRAQLYLGLGPDDEYEEYEEYEEQPAAVAPVARESREYEEPPVIAPVRAQPSAPRPAPPAARPAPPAARPAPPRPAAPPPPARVATTRPAPPGRQRQPAPEPVAEQSAVRTLPSSRGDAAPPPPKTKSVVRAVSAQAKPSVISPKSFNHAQEVADKFKASQPVILNLQGVDKELSRRLLDFCSGICYALGGHMEKVATKVYLLTPSNVEVSAEERRRLQERGLHDA
jgi:cell division inhibitor SepF